MSRNHAKHRGGARGRTRLAVERLEGRWVLACEAFVTDGTLMILGDDADDDIAVRVDPDPGALVAVTCQTTVGRQTRTFEGIMKIDADLGHGNDLFQLGMVDPGDLPPPDEPRTLDIVVRAGNGDDSVEIRHKSVYSLKTRSAQIDLGHGDDQFSAVFEPVPNDGRPPPDEPPTVEIGVMGGDGDDAVEVNYVSVMNSNLQLNADLGNGNDRFSALMQSTPDDGRPPPRVGWMTIGIISGQGDDEVLLDHSAGSFFDLLFTADLGNGNDRFSALMQSTPDDGRPPPTEARMVEIGVLAGEGDDTVEIDHSAGSFFDLLVEADLGHGNDRFSALMQSTPDDGLPGPEGMRTLMFDVLAGRGDDFVAARNLTDGSFFDVHFNADLGAGDDTFEAMGGIQPCIMPGEGFDTARVSGELFKLVLLFGFENIELIE